MTEVAYYTIAQASKILQLSQTSIYRGIKKGEIPRAKFCGKVLIPAWFIKQGMKRCYNKIKNPCLLSKSTRLNDNQPQPVNHKLKIP
jgi:excisionase family DNA binding protein